MPAAAELPMMEEKGWLGYFVGIKNKNLQFGIGADGKTAIRLIGAKGEPMGQDRTIPVEFRVEETMPDGNVISRKIKPESLESAQKPTSKPKDVIFKGMVTGDIGFEVFVTEERGGVSLGGRLLEPGTSKNPTRFCIAAKIPSMYDKARKGGDKKAQEALEERIENDRVQINRTDGKREKLSTTGPVDGASAEVTGPGLDAVLIDVNTYQGKKILLTASPNSSMAISNTSKQPLSDGFDVVWTADLAKDPQAKARMLIDVK